MNEFQHFLVTRFNLKIKGWDTTKNAESVLTDSWLQNRFELFETYCLPSVINQTDQDFIWYVCFDTETPQAYKKKIVKIEEKCRNFHPLFVDGSENYVHAVTQAITDELLTNDAPYIITTRMDNDDIIHQDFIASIQEAFVPVRDTVIDVREGYQLSIEKAKYQVREYSHPFNAFVSVIERRDSFRTVTDRMHYDWKDYDSVVVVDNKRLWIELVHQKNKANATLANVKKCYTFDAEAFSLEPERVELENKYSIFFSNTMLAIRLYLIGLIRKNSRIEAIARKLKRLFS